MSAMRRARTSHLIFGTIANAIYVLTLQALAMTTLEPAEYGAFSLQYLIFALAASICLSTLAEAGTRRNIQRGDPIDWRDYSGALVYLALTAGLLTLCVSSFIGHLRPVVWSGSLAVAASTYRVGARYFAVYNREHVRVLVADVVGIATTIAGWVLVFMIHSPSLEALGVIWALSSLVVALLSKRPALTSPSVLRRWTRGHRSEISRCSETRLCWISALSARRIC